MDACSVCRQIRELYLRAGFAFNSAEVILGGIRVASFFAPGRLPSETGPLRLLYASQLSADRGLHILVNAIDQLSPDKRSKLRLSVAGAGGDPEYRTSVERFVNEHD